MPSALERLYLRAPMGMRLGLGPMLDACARAGHPERTLRVVHVAGTNGKGSTCAMVASIARAAGLRAGMYTSPHLCRFAERIQIDGEPIGDDALSAALDRALGWGPDLSFFEVATLAAMVALREARVDVAVLEVGLGGRLDATNVVPRPVAAAITSISLDHTQMLGPTLRDIAREKAGIAKPGLDLVLGPIGGEALATIDQVAKAAGATTSRAADNREARDYVHHAIIGLHGAHQRHNATVAFMLGRRIGASAEACGEGLAKVTWPGRLETIETADGPVLLDAAHNHDGALSLAAHVRALGDRRIALVFGALADKEWPQMLDALAPLASHRVYVAPKGRAAAPIDALQARHAGELAASVDEAYRRARALVGDRGRVVACGSIFLVGELRGRLLGLPIDPPIAL